MHAPLETPQTDALRGDAIELLRSLPKACAATVFFDPQHRSVLDRQRYGNEGARQKGRCTLPAMSDDYIACCEREIARVLRPSGYLFSWVDVFRLCTGTHLERDLPCVGLIAWDNCRMGMGYRIRERGDYLLVLQKPPLLAKATWTDHGIPSRWAEKVDRKVHPHIKPAGLIRRLIVATTLPGDLVIDPAAGSFIVKHIAEELGRRFIGCDINGAPEGEHHDHQSADRGRRFGEVPHVLS